MLAKVTFGRRVEGAISKIAGFILDAGTSFLHGRPMRR